MRNIFTSVLLCTLLYASSSEGYSQIPEYYFDIDKVFSTSLSFSKGKNTFKYRVLAVKPSEFYNLTIEFYQTSNHDFGKGKLKNSYVIHDTDFDSISNGEVIVISKIELVKWVDYNNVILKINEDKCFSLSLEPAREDVTISVCSD